MVQFHRIRWPAPNTPEAAEPRPPIEQVPPEVPPVAYGVDMVQEEPHYQERQLPVATLGASPVVPSDVVIPTPLGFYAKSLVVDNMSGHTLLIPEISRYVPPYTTGYAIRCYPPINTVHVTVTAAGSLGGVVSVSATEEPLNPDSGLTATGQALSGADGSSGSGAIADGVLLQTGTSTYAIGRTPSVFKQNLAVAAGTTALWTPAAGKKFRLMRYRWEIRGNSSLAVAALEAFNLLDGATDISQTFEVWLPNASPNVNGQLASSGWIDLGNGILSAAANNVLNINVGTAFTSGGLRFICCGTEE